MSLTKTDLKAIKKMLDDFDDGISIRVANGLIDIESRLRKDILGSEAHLSQQIKNLTIRHEETIGLVLQHENRLTILETKT